MQRKVIATVCCCVICGACGGSTSPGEVTLKGQFVASSAASHSEPLLLAMGWYPTFVGTAPGSPVGAVITQSNIRYTGNFPVDFTFSLTGTPPAAGLFDLSTTGGTGHLAYGVLIAFRDMNRNGAFDADSAGRADGDVIAGVSVPDPSRPPPEHSYFVVYLDGKPAANDYFAAFPLKQGYNLLEIHYDYGVYPVPLSTSITIPITDSPALNLYACQAAFQYSDWLKRACGIDPYGGTWQAQGWVANSPTGTQALLYILDADGIVANASVLFDGAPFTYDSTGEDYNFTTSAIQGTHSLSFSVPGRSSETLAFSTPATVAVSSPTQNQSFTSGSAVTISWSRAAGTAYYDVTFLDDSTGNWLFHVITTEPGAVTPPISYVGPAHLTVMALGPLAVGSQGSFLTPMSATRVNVTFTR